MKKFFLCPVLTILFPFLLFAGSGKLLFNNISTESGLSSKMVLSAVQDNDGFMWFGTAEGLNRYDGYEFLVFRHIPGDTTSISSSWINCLYITRDGRLWIGTEKGLNTYDPVTETFSRFRTVNDERELLGNLRIRCVYEDTEGILWVGTLDGLIRLDPDRNYMNFHAFVSDKSRLMGNEVRTITEAPNGDLWIGTFDGLYNFRTSDNSFVKYDATIRRPGDQDNNHISSLRFHPSDTDILYVGTSTGLVVMDTHTGKVQTEYREDNSGIADNDIKSLGLYDDGNLIITTANGVSLFDMDSGTFESYNSVLLDGTSLPNETVWCVSEDSQGIIWLGTNDGIARLNLNRKRLDIVRTFTDDNGTLKKYMVNDILRAPDGDIWCTSNYGIMRYDGKGELKRKYVYGRDGLSHPISKRIITDRHGTIWVGTNNGVDYYDPRSGKFRPSGTGPEAPMLKYIYDLKEDPDGDIVANINSGICFITPRYGTAGDITGFGYRTVMIDDYLGSSNSDVSYFDVDGNGNVWLGTINDGLFRYDKKEGTFRQYRFDPADPGSINSDRIYTLHVDGNAAVWVGTDMGLCRLDPQSGRFQKFGDRPELARSMRTITSDIQGRLWIATLDQLIMFDYEHDLIIVSDLNTVVDLDELGYNSFYNSPDGNIYMGGNGAYIVFDPADIELNLTKAPLSLTSLEVGGRRIAPGEVVGKRKILAESITGTGSVRLAHNQNSFRIYFSLFDFASPAGNRYSYILQGSDKEYLSTGGYENYAAYSNLPPGKYIFKVRGSNPDGIWSDSEAVLAILIIPPWFQSWWAYLLYALSFCIMVGIAANLIMAKLSLSSELKLEKMERVKMEELNLIKMQFFTNVSHEFKTPLSLILGPIESLKESVSDSRQSAKLDMMQENAERLLRLINQIMDLRKIDNNKITLNTSQGDLVSFSRKVYDNFSYSADKKGVTLEFDPAVETLNLCFDADKMEKILYNLVSNALKFTDPGGKIGLRITKETVAGRAFAKVSVEDTGHGITIEGQARIFERFYQEDTSHTGNNSLGTGVGLAITREFVELHEGEISVKSVPGEGSCFEFIIPCDLEPARAPERTVQEQEFAEESDHFARPRILLVEDNEDMLMFLKMELDEHYEILTATDGKSGLATALDCSPDLIVSDVMMPGMDGLEFCSAIKKDMVTSHIPVVLLTARSDEASRNEGYMSGADGYIYKPFSVRTLRTRIDKMIESRNRMRESYRKRILAEPKEIKIESENDRFINGVVEVIEKNMSNPDFGVEDVCRELDYSYQQVYRKIKALTGETINEFVRSVRLKRAAQYLEKSDMRISEIMYEVGFNSHSYFTKCFREYYGISPKEYAASKRQPGTADLTRTGD